MSNTNQDSTTDQPKVEPSEHAHVLDVPFAVVDRFMHDTGELYSQHLEDTASSLLESAVTEFRDNFDTDPDGGLTPAEAIYNRKGSQVMYMLARVPKEMHTRLLLEVLLLAAEERVNA